MQTIARRGKVSSLSILFFFLTIISLAFYSEFFRRHESSKQIESSYSNIFDANAFGEVVAIDFKNRLGKFQLEKQENQKWVLKSPRIIDAKENSVNEIIDKIKSLTIIKIYEKDPINLSNFSLEQPTISIQLKNSEGKELKYHFGLLNPIDNTTYVTANSEKVIFQVQTLGRRIETMSLSNFLDSKIFSYPLDEISSYAIYRGNSKNAQLKIKKEKVGWKSSTGRMLDEKPLEGYFGNLANLSSTLIIDDMDEELKEVVNQYLETPFYRIEIDRTEKEGKKVVFEVSKLVTKLPNLNIERRTNVLVRSSDRKHLYLFHKDVLPVFQKTQYSFKKLSLKKIFY